MGYFPMCVDLTGKRVLLVGEGKQIRDKMEKLRSFQAQLVALQSLSAEDLCPRPALVIVGDIERVRARAIAAMCVEADVPVNVVDVPELCTFFFPLADHKRGFDRIDLHRRQKSGRGRLPAPPNPEGSSR